MIVINTVSDTKFSFNGITYHKNFMPFVTGDKIAILNVYDACITLTDAPTHFSEYVVNGVTYTSVETLQASLLDVIYTRLSLGTISGTGTVTNVSLSLGSTGTDVNGSVASPTTTPIITLNIPTASATNRGVLSASDWSLFNGKQNAITLTTIGSSGVATLVGSTLNIPNYSTDLTGYVTLDTAQTITGAKTLTSLLTGTRANFTSSGSGDTLGINHSSGSGIALYITKGGNGEGIYVNKSSGSGNAVTIVGTLNATTLVKNGGTSSQFLKADGSVDSNSYALVSQLHNPVTIGTANGLSLSGQVLSMALASGSVTGALSSANWTTFNNKQNALNGTGFVKISGTTISYDNSSYALASSLSGYLPLTGGTLTGALGGTSASFSSSVTAASYGFAIGGFKLKEYSSTASRNWIIGNDVAVFGDFAIQQSTTQTGSTYTVPFYINPSGNVGIGTTSPAFKLDVNGGTVSTYAKVGRDTGYILLGAGLNFSAIYARDNTDAQRPLYIEASNVLIGTETNSGYKLDVNGTGRFGGGIQINQLASEIQQIINSNSTSKPSITQYQVNGSSGWEHGMAGVGNSYSYFFSYGSFGLANSKFTLSTSGAATFSSSVTSTGFFVSSDITLKSLTKDKFDASKIDAISYKWRTDLQGKTLVGYSAQDVQKYMPDAVNTDSNGKLSVDYIQVLVQKIAHLETELKSLKNGLE
jgi:hypothetical protein